MSGIISRMMAAEVAAHALANKNEFINMVKEMAAQTPDKPENETRQMRRAREREEEKVFLRTMKRRGKI